MSRKRQLMTERNLKALSEQQPLSVEEFKSQCEEGKSPAILPAVHAYSERLQQMEMEEMEKLTAPDDHHMVWNGISIKPYPPMLVKSLNY